MRFLVSDFQTRLNFLRKHEYFDTMPESLIEQVARCMHLRQYERGEILFLEGDPCEGMYLLLSGSAKIYRLSTKGKQLIIRVLHPGETFAEVPAFDGGPNPVNVEALEQCRVWLVPSTTLRELILQHPPFAQKVILNFGRLLRSMVDALSEMAFYQITHRLARFLSELPADEQGIILTRITQEQMAAHLGTVREVVARSLKELEQTGAIRLEDRRIRIVNRDAFLPWI